MSTTQIVLIIITVLLLALGLWPIALLTIAGIVAIALHNRETKRKKKEEEFDELKKKVESLEREKNINEIIKSTDESRNAKNREEK